MDKEIKAVLKEIKELIVAKKFSDALKKCQEDVLSRDSSNYMGLVFAGVCSENIGSSLETENYFMKAAAVDANNILAWQGLSKLYDKLCSTSLSAMKSYSEFLKLLPVDDVRRFDTGLKVAKCVGINGDVDKAVIEFQLLQSQVGCDQNRQRDFDNSVIRTFRNAILNTSEAITLVQTAFEHVIAADSDCQDSTDSDVYLSLIDFLTKNDMLQEAVTCCQTHLNKIPIIVKKLSNILVEVYVCQGSLDLVVVAENITSLMDNAIGVCLDNDYSLEERMLTALDAVLDAEWDDAKETLGDGIFETAVDISKTRDALLGEAFLRQRNFWEAEIFLKKSLSVAQASFPTRIYQQLSEALIGKGDEASLAEAAALLKRLLHEAEIKVLENQRITVMETLFYVQLQLSDIDNAKKTLDELERVGLLRDRGHHLCAVGWLQFRKHQLDDALKTLLEAIVCPEVTPSLPVNYFIGRVHWAKSEPDRALVYFSKQAKLDPNHCHSWFFIGRCYIAINDGNLHHVEVAGNCFARAYKLNHRNLEIAESLNNAYRKLGKHQQNLELLLQLQHQHSPKQAKWVWFQLGIEYLATNQPDKAVTTLQSLIRHHSTDVMCWECLADAYRLRGSYEAAVKAYANVVKLTEAVPLERRDDSKGYFYALYQLAAMKLIMKEFLKAAEGFALVLEKSSSYIPALVGLGEALILQSYVYLKECRFSRMVESLSRAMVVFADALKLKSDLSIPWKLLGDALSAIRILPECELQLPVDIPLLFEDDGESSLYGLKSRLLMVGARCYMKAVTVSVNKTQLWHDLALNFLYQCYHLSTVKITGAHIQEYANRSMGKISNIHLLKTADDMAFVLSRKALEILKRIIQLEPSNFRYWSSLGCIAGFTMLKKRALAQHCFIKSIKLNPHCAYVWSNLGILYMQSDNIILAHRCFKMAQSVDPDFSAAWTAQALIAEKMNHHETMSLLRHAAELDFEPLAITGFAYHVIKSINDPVLEPLSVDHRFALEEGFALCWARDTMSKYLVIKPNDSCAWNYFGALLEADGLLRLSVSAFRRALNLLENDSKLVTEVSCNLGRVSGKLRDPDALKVLDSLVEPVLTVAAMKSLTCYRLARYDQALELLENCEYYTDYPQQDIDVNWAAQLVRCKQLMFAATPLPSQEIAMSENFTCTLAGVICQYFTKASNLPTIKRLIATVPMSTNQLLLLGRIFSLLFPDFKSKMKCCSLLIHRYPFISHSWFLLAEISARSGELELGRLSLKTCEKLDHSFLSKRDQQLLAALQIDNETKTTCQFRHLLPWVALP